MGCGVICLHREREIERSPLIRGTVITIKVKEPKKGVQMLTPKRVKKCLFKIRKDNPTMGYFFI